MCSQIQEKSARVGHAVRCRLPSALTFAAEAVAEAAAAMFPC